MREMRTDLGALAALTRAAMDARATAAATAGQPPPQPSNLFERIIAARGESGEALTDEQVVDEAMTFVLAGHETTAQLLSWVWSQLGNPEHARHLDRWVRMCELCLRMRGCNRV
jgi:cytochrome P450